MAGPAAGCIRRELRRRAPPEGASTEFGWQIVGYVTGGALGAWLGGIFVDELSVRLLWPWRPRPRACTVLVALAGVRSSGLGPPGLGGAAQRLRFGQR